VTESPNTAIDLMKREPVIPVVIVDRAVDAVPLARALLAGGVDTMEITLRTAILDAIRLVAEQVPDMAVGAGTIVRAEQAREAVGAGAAFLVSPGWTPPLLEALFDRPSPSCPARRPPAR
jgi:2-dehydro-3-deoxyphosphogluconate aldolase/(4S)-4-hydroxy-2-oxoglutarate aldolase